MNAGVVIICTDIIDNRVVIGIAKENAIVIVRACVACQYIVRGIDKINTCFTAVIRITGVVRAGIFFY